MAMSINDLTDDVTQTCEADATCDGLQERLRGDLLVCSEHARTMSARINDQIRCWCGYYRRIGTSCGEPCL